MALLISLLEVALVTETLAMNSADMMVVEVACDAAAAEGESAALAAWYRALAASAP